MNNLQVSCVLVTVSTPALFTVNGPTMIARKSRIVSESAMTMQAKRSVVSRESGGWIILEVALHFCIYITGASGVIVP